MAKKAVKTAMEIAGMIRRRLDMPEVRIGVFSNEKGWYATLYGAPNAELQAKIDRIARQLQHYYELDG